MTAISKNLPLAAYQHVADLLKDAGGPDGVVSRADAKALVSELNAQGRGTEALAADAIFRSIDEAEAAPGARVTGYDLSTHRAVVDRLLSAADQSGDGFLSDSERQSLEPAHRALVELGQILEMDAATGRIGHRVPRQGMEHIADLLEGAAGGDGRISRADAKGLVAQLREQGRGVEALACDVWFRFVDHRDFKSGANVTADDIARAVDYSDEHLLKNKDKNHNGFSRAEVDKFSTSAKAFLLVGQMIEAGIISHGAPAADGPLVVTDAMTLNSATAPALSERFFELCVTMGLDEHGYQSGAFAARDSLSAEDAAALHAGLSGAGRAPDHAYQSIDAAGLERFLDEMYGIPSDTDARHERFGELLAVLTDEAGGDTPQLFVSTAPAREPYEQDSTVLFVFPTAGKAFAMHLTV